VVLIVSFLMLLAGAYAVGDGRCGDDGWTEPLI
jgi:hypothetical protein